MKQLASSKTKKSDSDEFSGQQIRRSMIPRQENPPSITETNIEDILALDLSDTLINAGYNLTVTKITLGIHNLCDPLEGLFLRRKLWAFEGVKMFANRMRIFRQNIVGKKIVNQGQFSRSSIIMQIDILKQESLIKKPQNELILLTNEQQIEKVRNTIVTKLTRMVKILTRNHTKIKFQVLIRLQTIPNLTSPPKQAQKGSIQQTFQKYQQNGNNQRHFHRRSIDKQPQRKSSNQLRYSLNKQNQYQFSNRLKSPERNNKSRNLLYSYGNTDNKASTCSQTQSNNSQKEQKNLFKNCQSFQMGTKPIHMGNSILNKLKLTTPTKILPFPSSRVKNKSRVNSVLLNGSYFAEGTKERELEILRNKYFRLVEEFKDFSERFLQVIKEE